MAEIKTIINKAVAYDHEVVREYIKKHNFFIFGWEEIIKSDSIKNWLQIDIKCDKIPDKVFLNDEEYRLVKIKHS